MKKSAWEARAGEGPDNTAELPRRGDLLKGSWISPGTGLFDCPWGTGGRAGIWTLDGLVQHGQVHLLPADPRRSFGFFSPAEKRNPPAGGTPLSCKKAWQRTSCETAFRSRRLGCWSGFQIPARKTIHAQGPMESSALLFGRIPKRRRLTTGRLYRYNEEKQRIGWGEATWKSS